MERSDGSASQSTAPKAKQYEHLHINGQIEDLQSYFEQICHSFAGRKQSISHIIMKAETSLQSITNSPQIDLEDKLREVESAVTAKLNQGAEDVYEIQRLLGKFVTDEWAYFQETCKEEAADERVIIEVLLEASARQVQELKSLLGKSKFEAREGPSISKINNLLKEKCALLERELSNVKDNIGKCKKQSQKQLKGMLKVLQEIEEGRADRESKEECILAHIDKFDKQDQLPAGGSTTKG